MAVLPRPPAGNLWVFDRARLIPITDRQHRREGASRLTAYSNSTNLFTGMESPSNRMIADDSWNATTRGG